MSCPRHAGFYHYFIKGVNYKRFFPFLPVVELFNTNFKCYVRPFSANYEWKSIYRSAGQPQTRMPSSFCNNNMNLNKSQIPYNRIIWSYFNNNDKYAKQIVNDNFVQHILPVYVSQIVKNVHLPAIKEFISDSDPKADPSHGHKIKNNKYLKLFQGISLELNTNHVGFDEVVCSITLLKEWPIDQHSTYKRLCKALDDKCCQLLNNLSVPEMLLLCDAWFHVNRLKQTKFNTVVLNKLIEEELHNLSPSQYVQMMFYVSVERHFSPENSAKAEKKLLTVMNKLTMNELGIVSMGFFMTQNIYQDRDILEKLIKKTIDNAPALDSHTTVNLLKSFRKSSSFHVGASIHILFTKLLKVFVAHLEQFNLFACIQMCLLSSFNCKIYNQPLMSRTLERCCDEIENLRLKDISKLVFSIGLFNHSSSPEFINIANKEIIKRFHSEEIEMYPREVIRYLLSLSYLNIYETDLINEAFSEKFLENCNKKIKVEYVNDLYALDCNLQIDCDEYSGSRLPKHLVNIGKQNYEDWFLQIPKNSLSLKMMEDVSSALREIFKTDQRMLLRRMLPHYANPDLYFYLDHNKTLQTEMNPPDQFQPVDNWISIVYGGKNFYSYSSKQQTGNLCTKCRLLEKLGYKVIIVPWFQFDSLSSKEKVAYIRKKLRNYLKIIAK